MQIASNNRLRVRIEMMQSLSFNNDGPPRTEEEWNKLLAASEQMGIALFLMGGMSEKDARGLAKIIYGGAAGRILLEACLQEPSSIQDEYSARASRS
jgi:hypothetical protein